MFDLSQVRQAFNRTANTVDLADALSREVADRLMERFPLIHIQPQRILECGARSGYLTKQLLAYYPDAECIALDVADQPLRCISECSKVASHYASLPFKEKSVDMIVSSMDLHWINDFAACFREFKRILRPNGLLIFTLLGVDTFLELRNSFSSCHEFLHHFPDMHDVGDLLLQCEFENPVMDREVLMIHYQKLNTLFRDMKLSGASNAHCKRPKGLFGKDRWNEGILNYEDFKKAGAYPATFEIIYGHAWQLSETNDRVGGEVVVPIDRFF